MGQVPRERIVSDPDIMMGKPTIKGTRITVELILEKLGEGLAVEDVLRAHPHLTREQILAALRFAADYLRNEDIAFGSPEAAGPYWPTCDVPRGRMPPPRDRGAASGGTRGGSRRAERDGHDR
jgi:uncharacterized protein (DUF433 family)